MVSFQPSFKLMLVSLNLVVLLSFLAAPALADANHAAVHADSAVRRHATRAGRLSKRFPPAPEAGVNTHAINRRARHHRYDDHYYGLTPADIDALLNGEQIEDDGYDEPAANTFGATPSRSQRPPGTGTTSYSQFAATTSSSSWLYSFSLPTADSTSASHSTHPTSSASPSATFSDDSILTPTSSSHAFSQLQSHSSSPSASSSARPSSNHSPSTDSSNSRSSEPNTSSDGSESLSAFASSTSPASHTSAGSSSNGVNSLLSGLLSPTSTSSSSASHQTGGSHSDSDSGDDDDNGSSGSPSATSSSSTPTAIRSSHSSSSSDSTDDQANSTDASPSSSKQSQTSQPDFFSFTPQTSRSASHSPATPTSTASGLLQSVVHVSIGSSSGASTARPSATPSPSDSGSDGDSGSTSDSSPASSQHSSGHSSDSSFGGASTGLGASQTSSSRSSAPTSTADESEGSDNNSTVPSATRTSTTHASAPTTATDGSSSGSGSGTNASQTSQIPQTHTASSTDDGTASATATSASPQTVTAGPTPTATDSGSTSTSTSGTGANTDSGSDSASSSADQPSSSSSSSSASHSSSSSSSSSDSSDRGSSTSSSATTNPYWYANTQSLHIAPSSTSSADPAAQTQSSSSSDGSSGSTTSSSSGVINGPASQDLPTTIVPSADSFEQPPDTTAIGLLFKQDMQWTWVISQADLTAQIFAFMPEIVGTSAGLDSAKVSTVKLSSYSVEASQTATSRTLDTARTLYVAYVPTSSVEEIQALVSNTSSPFYASAAAGAPKQLASQVDPTFNILSVAGNGATGTKQNAKASSGSSSDDSTLRNSLIGVGCGLAGIFALVAGGLVWRKQRSQAKGGAEGAAKDGGASRAHTIRSFHGGLRETWAPDALDQHRALEPAGEMEQVWSPHDGGMATGQPGQQAVYGHGPADGFGGYVSSDPFHDAAAGGVAGGYVNMNRSSRMTERSTYSDLSQMTEAQRIQYDYEASRRSFQSVSDHSGSHGSNSGLSHESAGMLSTYQEDYRVPRQHTSNHAFGQRSNSTTRSRRRGSVASSTIGRPEMMSNSVLL